MCLFYFRFTNVDQDLTEDIWKKNVEKIKMEGNDFVDVKLGQ